MSNINQSNPHTGGGGQSALLCAGCGTGLKPSEVCACTGCLNFWLLADPAYDMTGENDG